MPISPTLASARASYVRRLQSYPEGHPRVVEARRNLAFERLREQVETVVRDWPALTMQQVENIVGMLQTGSNGGGVDETS